MGDSHCVPHALCIKIAAAVHGVQSCCCSPPRRSCTCLPGSRAGPLGAVSLYGSTAYVLRHAACELGSGRCSAATIAFQSKIMARAPDRTHGARFKCFLGDFWV